MKKIKEIFFKNNRRSDVDIVGITDAIYNKLGEISFRGVRREIGADHWQERYDLPGGWDIVILECGPHKNSRSYQEITLTIERFKPPLPMDFPLFLNEVKDLIKKHKLKRAKIK